MPKCLLVYNYWGEPLRHTVYPKVNSESLGYVKQMLSKVSLLIRHKVDLPLWIRRMSWQSSVDISQHPGQTSSTLLSVTWSSLTCNRFQDKGTETPTDFVTQKTALDKVQLLWSLSSSSPTPTAGDTQAISKPGTFCLLQILPKLSYKIFHFKKKFTKCIYPFY